MDNFFVRHISKLFSCLLFVKSNIAFYLRAFLHSLQWLRQIARLLLVLLLFMPTLEIMSFSTVQTSFSAPTTAGNVLGVYGGPGPTGLSNVQAASQVLGHPVKYATDFLDPTSWSKMENPQWFLNTWKGKGYQMIWGVPMLPNTGGYTLAAGANGNYNSYFSTLAQNLVSNGQGNSIIRLGWEFNGSWFPWSANGQASNFVQYWKNIVNTMRSVPGQSFIFEWNPTIGNLGVGNLALYYPGNSYVDIIGLDVYDVAWKTYPGATNQWNNLVNEPYGLNWLSTFGALHNKPLSIPEWGLGWNSGSEVSGGDNAYFVQQMANWISTHNVVNAIVWDNSLSSTYLGNPTPIPSAAAPLATAALIKYFGTASPSFQSYPSVVARSATNNGTGSYLASSNGGIFAFNAPFYGSMGGTPLNKPIVGMAVDPQTGGYWEVASDGNLITF